MDAIESLYTDITNRIWMKDLTLLHCVSTVYFIAAVVVFLILVFGTTAPYGRYTRGGWGIYLNGKYAWFVQELPSFVIPVTFLVLDQHASISHAIPNVLLTMMFIVHYFHRYVI